MLETKNENEKFIMIKNIKKEVKIQRLKCILSKKKM